MKNGLIIYDNGTKEYYQDGKLHREDGPAYENIYARREWFLYGDRHRIDGPAIVLFNNSKYWYYYGKFIPCKTQEEFEKYMKLKAFW